MKRISVKQLRENLDDCLTEVKSGVTYMVTDQGERVAVIKPVEDPKAVLESLVESGRLTTAKRSFHDLELPEEPVDESRAVSRHLQEMREERL